MDDSVSIIYEKINPRPEIEVTAVVSKSEENVKDQQIFSILARPSFADIAENKTTFENGFPFDDPEEGSSKNIPQSSQMRDAFHGVEVPFSNQNFLDTTPGIMLNTEIMPPLEEPLEIIEHFDQEALPRSTKRKINDSESQDEVATKKEEQSLKIKITKTSPSNWRVINLKKHKMDQPVMDPHQQLSHCTSRQAFFDYLDRVRPNCSLDCQEPAKAAPYSAASTSADHSWAYQPQPSEQQAPAQDPNTPRSCADLDARIQTLRDLGKRFASKRSLLTADHETARIPPPSTYSRTHAFAPLIQPPHQPQMNVVRVPTERRRGPFADKETLLRHFRALLRARNRMNMVNFLPQFNFPPFLENVPEPTPADKPQPQESYQKEKKLKTWKEEFEKDDYNTLVALSDMGLVANVEPFECPICFSEVPVGEGVLLHECLHSFCRDCLEGTIKHSDTVSIRCPFANEEYLCESYLQEREIKSLVSPDLFEKYLARGLALAESQAPDSFHCKTPDCPGWCLFEDNVVTFACPVCKRTNCLTCGAVHEGMNCRQYQDWLLELESDTSDETKKTRECLKGLVAEGKAMVCPVCHIVLMKISGCDALTCRMCRTQLCWVTRGTRWGPQGPGDTSGGCKCNLGGVRCHPQCTGCH